MKIALDAMGGDNAPSINVEGAVLAFKQKPSSKIKVLLIGPEKLLKEELAKYEKKYKIKIPAQNLEIVNAGEVIDMHDHPAQAVRNKKDSSIVIGAKLVGEKNADAFVSMGNSGAVMTAALLHMKRIDGVHRPAISTEFPTQDGRCLILDVGANADCKPIHLLQFGIMGSIYAQKVMGIQNPRVGLVSIGEEETKGNELTLATYPVLKKSSLNFIGNIEGRDIPKSNVDVAVCDGFVGNVILKFGEGLGRMLFTLIKKALKKHPMVWAALPFIWLALKGLRKKIDPEEVGGAPLLGVNGVCIIGHGSSGSKAVKNAIFTTARAVSKNVTSEIKEEIANFNTANPDLAG
ncbi:MAG: phosphate acyltransferase PlsX [Elusimicrobia bacterium]|nr:phosphate acyltransferase PlsX [Elusimicrobiota bacterium]